MTTTVLTPQFLNAAGTGLDVFGRVFGGLSDMQAGSDARQASEFQAAQLRQNAGQAQVEVQEEAVEALVVLMQQERQEETVLRETTQEVLGQMQEEQAEEREGLRERQVLARVITPVEAVAEVEQAVFRS